VRSSGEGAGDDQSLGNLNTMPADDLVALSDELRSRARVDSNGEVSWHVDDTPSTLRELAAAGRVVLGLDVRDYDETGSFVEIAWSVFEGSDPIEAGDAAMEALLRDGLPGDWVLITWTSPMP